jgi:hypothetical protein
LPTQVGIAVACCDFNRPNHIGQMNLLPHKAMSAGADNNYNRRADESAATPGNVRLRGQLPLPTKVGIAVACCDFSRPTSTSTSNLYKFWTRNLHNVRVMQVHFYCKT